jgi:hypothetical protein
LQHRKKERKDDLPIKRKSGYFSLCVCVRIEARWRVKIYLWESNIIAREGGGVRQLLFLFLVFEGVFFWLLEKNTRRMLLLSKPAVGYRISLSQHSFLLLSCGRLSYSSPDAFAGCWQHKGQREKHTHTRLCVCVKTIYYSSIYKESFCGRGLIWESNYKTWHVIDERCN